MKRVILIVLLLVTGIAAFVFVKMNDQGDSSPRDLLSKSEDEILKIPKTHVESTLSKVFSEETTKSKAFQNFVDPKIPTLFYLREGDLPKEEAKEFLASSYKTLTDCLETHCGQGPDADGFFDPAKTVAALSLKKILQISTNDPEFTGVADWLSKDSLLEILDHPNPDLRALSVTSLFQNYKSPQLFEEVLNASRDLEGYSAGTTIEQLKKYVNKDNKQAFLDTLENIAREKDGFTITEVIEKVEDMSLSQKEIQDLGTSLCRFKAEKENFNALAFSMKNVAKASRVQYNLKASCP